VTHAGVDLGVMLAEAYERKWRLEREMSVCEAQIRTLASEILAAARTPPPPPVIEEPVLRVAGYVGGKTLEEQAEEAYANNHGKTFAWTPLADALHKIFPGERSL
jgi:hypothetical protein